MLLGKSAHVWGQHPIVHLPDPELEPPPSLPPSPTSPVPHKLGPPPPQNSPVGQTPASVRPHCAVIPPQPSAWLLQVPAGKSAQVFGVQMEASCAPPLLDAGPPLPELLAPELPPDPALPSPEPESLFAEPDPERLPVVASLPLLEPELVPDPRDGENAALLNARVATRRAVEGVDRPPAAHRQASRDGQRHDSGQRVLHAADCPPSTPFPSRAPARTGGKSQARDADYPLAIVEGFCAGDGDGDAPNLDVFTSTPV